MPDAQPRVGYGHLLSMPDDGRRYEIHGGELVVVPAPRLRHSLSKCPRAFSTPVAGSTRRREILSKVVDRE